MSGRARRTVDCRWATECSLARSPTPRRPAWLTSSLRPARSGAGRGSRGRPLSPSRCLTFPPRGEFYGHPPAPSRCPRRGGYAWPSRASLTRGCGYLCNHTRRGPRLRKVSARPKTAQNTRNVQSNHTYSEVAWPVPSRAVAAVQTGVGPAARGVQHDPLPHLRRGKRPAPPSADLSREARTRACRSRQVGQTGVEDRNLGVEERRLRVCLLVRVRGVAAGGWWNCARGARLGRAASCAARCAGIATTAATRTTVEPVAPGPRGRRRLRPSTACGRWARARR